MLARSVVLCVWNLLFLSALVGQVVPAPRQFEASQSVTAGAVVAIGDEALAPTAEAFVAALRALGAKDASIGSAGGAAVLFEKPAGAASGEAPESYSIATEQGQLRVRGLDPEGFARAAATLLQLARIGLDGGVRWPQVTVNDGPDRDFRCFMVDMGRNPHGPETLRKIVDALWVLKVRYLHLHLGDDQLWSWPSKAFPKLRSERAGWSWDDFVALEAYSQARGVTLVPEVDVPGHSTILRREYPEVFGKTPTDLATLPEATAGIERLLAEILEVFQATPYVHVGGDEAYGVPEDAQRDFINRLNRFVKSTGRRTVVWEGPRLGEGEHKVDTDVLQMNWRTINFPAQEMLDAGYEVVNAAWDPLYIVDHYPRTMFTAVPVQGCYDWDIRRFAHVNHGMPTFAKPHVTKTEEGILGYCMPWWEGREENVLALCVARLAAVNAAAWNRGGESDFADFERRYAALRVRLERLLGSSLTGIPLAPDAPADLNSGLDNLALGAAVTASRGASQPVFGPSRLTNGSTARFDHFLGYPTQPDPLRITIDLGRVVEVGRVVVHEASVGKSHELYSLHLSVDGTSFDPVGKTSPESRGEATYVGHTFAPRAVRFVRIDTQGCHGLTFPSFSRLCEVEVFAR